LSNTVSGQESVVVLPAPRYDLCLQKRENDMATPENERSGAIKTVEEWKPPVPFAVREQRHD
jgi:hypothetical protein